MLVNDKRIERARALYEEETGGNQNLMKLRQAEWTIRQSGKRINGSALLFSPSPAPRMWSKITNSTFVVHGEASYRRVFADSRNQALRMYYVNYSTTVETWPRDLSKQVLNTLPHEVERSRYDLVIVNGPSGRTGRSPGRVSAILHARMLVKEGGMIFVYDFDRELEKAVSTELLGEPDAIDKSISTVAMWKR